MKLVVSFPEGAYSSNKIEVKKVFKTLGYNYKFGKEQNEHLICVWIREPEKQKIQAIFNGSGKECTFTIECNDDEYEVFKLFEPSFNARVSLYNKDTVDTRQLLEKAKQRIDSWWTPTKQHKREPDLFFTKRKEKEAQSYEWFVQKELEKLKGEL